MKMERVIVELIEKEFPLRDAAMRKEIERISIETIKFCHGSQCQEELQEELNRKRDEIKKEIKKIKKVSRGKKTSKKEKERFARRVLTLLIELSALSVNGNSNSPPVINSFISTIISQSELKKLLREMLADEIKELGVVNQLKRFYQDCQRIFLAIKIVSLRPDLNLCSQEVDPKRNIEVLKTLIERINGKNISIYEINEIEIRKIEGEIAKRY